MKPTNKLRFVRRIETHTPQGGNPIDKEVTILQQWWSVGLVEAAKNPSRAGDGEWRDVPLETE
jgi:hypothetical protein